MLFYILGKEGKIGKYFTATVGIENTTDNYHEADIVVLCVPANEAKNIILNENNRIILNFSSFKPSKPNLINGIGCSTLSIYLPLIKLKEYFHLIEGNINVVSLFPQSALSNKSENKNLSFNQPIRTLEHNHQIEIEHLLNLPVNISHFITPAEKTLTSNIFLTFKKEINLFDIIPNYKVSTRDFLTWNIISDIDNIQDPIDYLLEKLKEH